ncbi:hypothetical protein MLD38_016474 [Melastoma candidum]|uniref:Uncharacterized protein n=1 Tax=Melastoma candidum TaxID=119954 RepID=A0ACB9QN35_9MYRT|nr:hypothetical protein MLD38_016474 [Melastoma candidum]
MVIEAGSLTESRDGRRIKGTVVLMKKNSLEFNDLGASFLDRVFELFGQKVTLQLVSAVRGDPDNGGKGKVGKPAYLEKWITTASPLMASDSTYEVTFDWDDEIGLPGAIVVRNNHYSEFYLKTITLEDVPGHRRVHFVCNSWVYPVKYYKSSRIFFSNNTYLPSQTPTPLIKFRQEELISLRGDGKGQLKKWDRVYDYAYYNDLGDPDKGSEYARPVIGGSVEFPYPRRGRTGRKPTKSDPNTESKLPDFDVLNIYVPRDERLGRIKISYISAFRLKSSIRTIETFLHGSTKEFGSFRDELSSLYEGGIKLPEHLVEFIKKIVPLEFVKDLLPADGEGLFKYPMPKVIQHDKSAWMTDEEFTREMLAGVHPVAIRRLQEFPPASKLDAAVYGNQASSITEGDIKDRLDGLSVREAIKKNRLFILDHHDMVMPYLRRTNMMGAKTYATRTLLFLRQDGTLKPLAIELSLPHPEGDQYGSVSQVYTPFDEGIEGNLWQLAKVYAVINDVGHHGLISHWLNTHAVIEPFVIAMNRQLSVVHPIHKLLHPHFRDTMNTNALAREVVFGAEGTAESIVFTSKCSMELSSAAYKDWIFPEQALPADLIRRGMAVEDSNTPHGLRLMIEDYPYAVDGLEVWSAIEIWVKDYCFFYYRTDKEVQNDVELQAWWKELVEVGHGDKKDELWWPRMQALKDLTGTCTTIIWVASALHAVMNFGQYPYGGYLPNRPATSRRFMPKEGTPEYEELEKDPEKVLLKTIPGRGDTLMGISLFEQQSRHLTDEVYLGQRDTPEWTSDGEPLEALQKFKKKLEEIEGRISQMNSDKRWKNRVGPANMPFSSLSPGSSEGITGKGIPNSISM